MSPSDGSAVRLHAALGRFDEMNSEDPRSIQSDGRKEPFELVYSRRMSARLAQFQHEASDSLRLAVHAQHLCRWRLPRTELPPGRAGYREWRRRCGEMHAELAAGVLRDVGYPETTVLEVGHLLRKVDLPTDPLTQALEDVACLVFLESYAEAFLQSRGDASVQRILRRTWRKMSPRARAASIELPLPTAVSSLVKRHIEGETDGR